MLRVMEEMPAIQASLHAAAPALGAYVPQPQAPDAQAPAHNSVVARPEPAAAREQAGAQAQLRQPSPQAATPPQGMAAAPQPVAPPAAAPRPSGSGGSTPPADPTSHFVEQAAAAVVQSFEFDGVDRLALKRTKGGRYLADITREELLKYSHMPIDEAAKVLGIGLTSLKTRCRECGIQRWPFRDMKRAVVRAAKNKILAAQGTGGAASPSLSGGRAPLAPPLPADAAAPLAGKAQEILAGMLARPARSAALATSAAAAPPAQQHAPQYAQHGSVPVLVQPAALHGGGGAPQHTQQAAQLQDLLRSLQQQQQQGGVPPLAPVPQPVPAPQPADGGRGPQTEQLLSLLQSLGGGGGSPSPAGQRPAPLSVTHAPSVTVTVAPAQQQQQQAAGGGGTNNLLAMLSALTSQGQGGAAPPATQLPLQPQPGAAPRAHHEGYHAHVHAYGPVTTPALHAHQSNGAAAAHPAVPGGLSPDLLDMALAAMKSSEGGGAGAEAPSSHGAPPQRQHQYAAPPMGNGYASAPAPAALTSLQGGSGGVEAHGASAQHELLQRLGSLVGSGGMAGMSSPGNPLNRVPM